MFDALGRHSPIYLIEKNKIKFCFGNCVGFSPDKVKPNPSAKPSLSPACLRVMVTFSGCWFSTYHWKSGTVLIRPQILIEKEKRWIRLEIIGLLLIAIYLVSFMKGETV
jgi:hypothetical protein